MYVFDARGRAASVFYGAPADLHVRAGRAIETLLSKQPRRAQ
jgi:hypothetical protein